MSMTKIRTAKYRISRRLVINLWGREKDPVKKKNYVCGQHGQTVSRRISNFSLQLCAKQQMRMYYNMTESQFHKFFDIAHRMKGDSGENLVGLLETRLDAVIFRSNFVATIFAAGQIINHGHVDRKSVV